MPKAKPPQPPETPAPLSPIESEFIKSTVRRLYGPDAVVRNFGPDPKRLQLHVEYGSEISPMLVHECLGYLLCEIARDAVSLEGTRRGAKARGNAKLAYRQGVVL